MTILVENECLPKFPKTVSSFYEKYPSFKANSAKFISQPLQTIKTENVLFVAQKEYAIVKTDDSLFKVTGTDDATTCHIVVMKNEEESTICVAHIDSADCFESLSQMVLEVVGNCSLNTDFYIELSIFGGYCDERETSESLTLDLLQFYHSCRVKFKLHNMCVGSANTTRKKGINYPIIYGIAVDLRSNLIFPASFPLNTRGPQLPLRSSRGFCDVSKLYRIYHTKDGTLKIEPFNYHCPSRIMEWLRMSDAFILQNFSTSPDVEPEHFTLQMREVFAHIAKHPFPMHTIFKSNKTIQYSVSPVSGEWQEI